MYGCIKKMRKKKKKRNPTVFRTKFLSFFFHFTEVIVNLVLPIHIWGIAGKTKKAEVSLHLSYSPERGKKETVMFLTLKNV